MKTDHLALEVENYSTAPARNAPSPTPEGAGVSIPGLLALTVFFTAFVIVAVCLGQIAGAC